MTIETQHQGPVVWSTLLRTPPNPLQELEGSIVRNRLTLYRLERQTETHSQLTTQHSAHNIPGYITQSNASKKKGKKQTNSATLDIQG